MQHIRLNLALRHLCILFCITLGFLAIQYILRHDLITKARTPRLKTYRENVRQPNLVPFQRVKEKNASSPWTLVPSAQKYSFLTNADHSYTIPSADDVVLILKTGRATPADRLEAQLATFASASYGRTPRNTLIVSDSNKTVVAAGFEWSVIDVVAHLTGIAEVTESEKYQTYLHQNKLDAAQQSTTTTDLPGSNNAGWSLDVYKFLPAYSLAAKSFPEAKWFIGLDDDNYLFWDSLFEFLALLDHNEELYIGSPSWFSANVKFIHGGSVTISSQAAVKARFIKGAKRLNKFHRAATKECCGDGILAMAYADIGIQPNDKFADFFNGENLATARVTSENICKPVIGLHHLTGEDTSTIHRYWSPKHSIATETSHAVTTWGHLLDMKDRKMLKQVAQPGGVSNWDFLQIDENMEKIAVAWDTDKTVEVCQSTCHYNPDRCLAWTFLADKQECWISPVVVGGKTVPRSTSGINMKRIKDIREACSEHDWRKAVVKIVTNSPFP